jgi:hypothetical protein
LSGQPLLLTNESEQQMLTPDLGVLHRARLVLREHHNLPRPFREPLEHSETVTQAELPNWTRR